MRHALLQAESLAAGYQGSAVIRGIDVAVAYGERVALVGTNGSGKTTLLQVLAGLAVPLEGELRWEGEAFPTAQARVSQIGVCFQRERATAFTAYSLVAMGLGLSRPLTPEESQRVHDTLRLVHADQLDARRCDQLSGGEFQRVLLARALVANPKLVILDEPTNHLDPSSRATLLFLLDRLKERGVAVCLASHDLALAARCDSVYLLGRPAGESACPSVCLRKGHPADVLTSSALERAFGVPIRRVCDPEAGFPLFDIDAHAHSYSHSKGQGIS